MVSKELNPSVQIKLRIGELQVELEAPKSEIAKMVSQVIAQIPKDAAYGPVSVKRQPLKASLRKLVEQGYLKESRRLPEIIEELRKLGYVYGSGSVSHELANMSREGLLIREGSLRHFSYRSHR